MIPRESIEALVEYIVEDEAADYVEQGHGGPDGDGDPHGVHIYTHAMRVRGWLTPLVLTVPRDDFALLMDVIARCEQGQKLSIDDLMVAELSRVAADLSEQADAQ